MRKQNRLNRVAKYLAFNDLYKEAAYIKKLAQMVGGDGNQQGDEFNGDDEYGQSGDEPYSDEEADFLNATGMDADTLNRLRSEFPSLNLQELRDIWRKREELFDILQGRRRWGGNI